MKIIKWFNENTLLYIGYSIVFLFVIFQDAIYSPDTTSYIKAVIHRSPGYPIFVNFLAFIFRDLFNLALVSTQILLGLFSVHLFFKTTSSTFNLSCFYKIPLLIILVFPFFSPLLIANNISSEGLSYPLYLIFTTYVIKFFQNNNSKSFYALTISCILLTLTRGQFIITPVIIAFVCIITLKRSAFELQNLKKVIILILLPFTIVILDKSYHLLKDGKFVSTPFTYICLSGSSFYVSELSDLEDISNENDKTIFLDCYNFLEENNWLLSSKERKSYKDYYNHFHNNLGNICNYTVHDRGRKFYTDNGYSAVEASIEIENTSKRISFVTIKNNFQKWIRLYYSNLVHSFKSQIILFFIIIVFIISGIKLLKSKSKSYTFLCLFSALILSNAMLVVFASHSIMRYLFYNFALFYLILLILAKLLLHGKKN